MNSRTPACTPRRHQSCNRCASPASLECAEWGTLQIGGNRVVIGLIKRVHLRDELFDADKKRVRTEKLMTIGRMASPHWYCKPGDRFEMKRPD